MSGHIYGSVEDSESSAVTHLASARRQFHRNGIPGIKKSRLTWYQAV